MGRLVQLELEDFKSYKGRQIIGPFHDFTSIVGPNGSGKSNLMDAISFVLGVKSAHLRSHHLKELVHRSSLKETDGTQAAEKCTVSLKYEDDDGRQVLYNRSVTDSGSSDYRIDGKMVSAKDYTQDLEKHNILVKARNFLVFQGDIEAVASQSPKDLTRLIEQISGSLELKNEYEALKVDHEKALEESAYHFTKKRSINAEVRTWQEQKKEADLFDKKSKEQARLAVKHIVWKLFHFEEHTNDLANSLREQAVQKAESAKEINRVEKQVTTVRSKYTNALKKASNKEKQVKAKEKDLQARKPELVAVEEKLTLIRKTAQKYQNRIDQIEVEGRRQQHDIDELQDQLRKVERARAKYEREATQALKSKGNALEGDLLDEYKKLKEQLRRQASEQFLSLEKINRNYKTSQQVVDNLSEKLSSLHQQQEKATVELKKLQNKQENDRDQLSTLKDEIGQKKRSLREESDGRSRISQTEVETNEKLAECLSKLAEADANANETKREARERELLADLKRNFAGVHGSVAELMRPHQRKYDLAISAVLGRHLGSIVVNSQSTAKECLQYLRDGRKGQATFIPLDTILTGPLNAQLRSLSSRVRLAIDILEFDPQYERAANMICGNAIVTDDLSLAREMCYGRNLRVKAVTVDGTVVHKSGMITGGAEKAVSSSKWDSAHVEKLTKLRDRLLSELSELARKKKSMIPSEDKHNELASIESRLSLMEEESNATRRTIEGRQREIEKVQAQIAEVTTQKNNAVQDLQKAHSERDAIESEIAAVQDDLFRDLCRRIKVRDIRQYETSQGKDQIDIDNNLTKYDTQLSSIRNRLSFEENHKRETERRITSLNEKARREHELTSEFIEESNNIGQAIDTLSAEIEILSEEYDRENQKVKEIQNSLEQVTNELRDRMKAHESTTQDIRKARTDIERTLFERHALLRRCRLDNLALPLNSGSLKDLPLDELTAHRGDMVDVDSDDPLSNFDLSLFGIEVDYSSLSEELRRDASADAESAMIDRLSSLDAELEALHPNLKAIDKLGSVQDRATTTETDWQKARKDANKVSERFEQVRRKRFDLFMKAFTHISEQIDPIYKELTTSSTFPLGGTAYLTLEDNEEPFLHGIKYHAMPPTKRFRDIEQLSGGEKTMAALALLFAIHSYQPSPFFVLDEVDAALDNQNIARVAQYIKSHAGEGFQFIVISLSSNLFNHSEALVGIYRENVEMSSRCLTVDLGQYAE